MAGNNGTLHTLLPVNRWWDTPGESPRVSPPAQVVNEYIHAKACAGRVIATLTDLNVFVCGQIGIAHPARFDTRYEQNGSADRGCEFQQPFHRLPVVANHSIGS